MDSDKCMFEPPATEEVVGICVWYPEQLPFLCPAKILSEGIEAVASMQYKVLRFFLC